MPLNDARKLVEKMKENQNFRKKLSDAPSPEGLTSILESEALVFDQRELIGAMAECMSQLEQEMGA